MRRTLVPLTLLLLLLPGTALALDIDGKWGLGAGIADDNGEISLIRGRGNGALILDLTFNLGRRELEEQEPTVNPDIESKQEFWSFTVGPRLRRYTRAGQSLSPYLDLFAHAVSSFNSFTQTIPLSSTTQENRQLGGQLGLGLGAEWDTGWGGLHVAIHTDVFTAQMVNEKAKQNSPTVDTDQSGTTWNFFGSFSPDLFARVYF